MYLILAIVSFKCFKIVILSTLIFPNSGSKEVGGRGQQERVILLVRNTVHTFLLLVSSRKLQNWSQREGEGVVFSNTALPRDM